MKRFHSKKKVNIHNKMDTLSPNWVALSTVHIRYQEFVTEGTKTPNPANQKRSAPISTINLSGRDVASFYEEVTSAPSNKEEVPPKIVKRRVKTKPLTEKVKTVPIQTFNKNALFRAAVEDNYELVFEICNKNPELINETDGFGWTALMMAACEGSEKVFSILLVFGADFNVTDKRNHTAITLAENKNRENILQAFSEFNQKKNENSSAELSETATVEEQRSDPFFCETCEHIFKESTREQHNTSTLHQFNVKHHDFPRRFGIAETNRGFQLMLKQGWDRNSGLGPSRSGHLFPVKTVLREFRSGLGVDQDNTPRVTHFRPYDLRAIKRRKSPPRPETKKDRDRRMIRERRKERKIRNDLS